MHKCDRDLHFSIGPVFRSIGGDNRHAGQQIFKGFGHWLAIVIIGQRDVGHADIAGIKIRGKIGVGNTADNPHDIRKTILGCQLP